MAGRKKQRETKKYVLSLIHLICLQLIFFSRFQRVFRALYDYEAQDTDEVSFTEGDLIFEVDSIDAGWMTGRVERTGQTGMLPANYVEPAII